jgi:hypothetical protein
MRSHNGMRPQDIVVLLKIIALEKIPWQSKDLARSLYLSPSEISLSLQRSAIAGLLSTDKKRVHRLTFLEFLRYGLHVVFPVIPGGIVNGIYTAHSYPEFSKLFSSNEQYVWPDVKGKDRGQSLEPLYKEVTKAVAEDEELYHTLALLDIIRVGRTRELQFALEELKRRIK